MFEQFFFLGVAIFFGVLYLIDNPKNVTKDVWIIIALAFLLPAFFNNYTLVSTRSYSNYNATLNTTQTTTLYNYQVQPDLSGYGFALGICLIVIIALYLWNFLMNVWNMAMGKSK